jgi:hypothetical protein
VIALAAVCLARGIDPNSAHSHLRHYLCHFIGVNLTISQLRKLWTTNSAVSIQTRFRRLHRSNVAALRDPPSAAIGKVFFRDFFFTGYRTKLGIKCREKRSGRNSPCQHSHRNPTLLGLFRTWENRRRFQIMALCNPPSSSLDAIESKSAKPTIRKKKHFADPFFKADVNRQNPS